MPVPDAEPSNAPVLSRAQYFERWSDLHGGIDPAAVPFVRGWLSIAYAAARPVARAGVAPMGLTLLGLLVACGVPVVAGLGAWWPFLGVPLAVASGLLDNLDGAVAVLRGRVSRWGALVDAMCDRIADAAYGVALWRLGAPAWLALLWVGLGVLAEYTRLRGQLLVEGPLDLVTVGERPTRIVLTCFALAGAVVWSAHAHVVATAFAVASAGTAGVGLCQLLVHLRRRLR